MRLIDADEVVNTLKKFGAYSDKVYVSNVIELIKWQPTACDNKGRGKIMAAIKAIGTVKWRLQKLMCQQYWHMLSRVKITTKSKKDGILMNVKVERSKATGDPCLWEEWEGYSNSGHATIIVNKYGKSKVPINIRRCRKLVCWQHTLIPIQIGDFVINTSHFYGNYTTRVFVISEINDEENIAILEETNCFSKGEWDVSPDDFLKDAVEESRKESSHSSCHSANMKRSHKHGTEQKNSRD